MAQERNMPQGLIISRLEFWGVNIAILGSVLGITLALFMHLNDRTDGIMREIQVTNKEICRIREEIKDIDLKFQSEIKDIKLNQAWLERTKRDKE